MPDKAFNELPMVVVVSDALDPRTKRQLQSQLQAEMKTISEVDAEVKNAESMANVKQQYDSAKDESKFDDNETKEEATPQPIENGSQNDNTQGDTATKTDDGSATPDQGSTPEGTGQAAGESSSADAFTDGQDGPGSSEENKPDDGKSGNSADVFNGESEGGGASNGGEATPNAQNVQSQPQANDQQQAGQGKPDQANQAQQSGDDPFTGEGGQAQSQEAGNQNQQAQNNQQNDTQQQQNQSSDGNSSGDADGDDPFAENQPTFEAFAGILGLKYESAEQQTAESNLPPMKQLTYIKGSDRGVDDRTNGVVAALEDPQNTVVVLDLGDVTEAEAKMQFQSVKKQMQGRGITVVDTIDEGVEFLNDVYDQIAGKSE